MIILVYVALLGWIPVCLALFVALPARQAAVAGVIGAWLLLPPVSMPVALLPDYDKSMAAVVGIILATLIFQPHRLLGFRAPVVRPADRDLVPLPHRLIPEQ